MMDFLHALAMLASAWLVVATVPYAASTVKAGGGRPAIYTVFDRAVVTAILIDSIVGFLYLYSSKSSMLRGDILDLQHPYPALAFFRLGYIALAGGTWALQVLAHGLPPAHQPAIFFLDCAALLSLFALFARAAVVDSLGGGLGATRALEVMSFASHLAVAAAPLLASLLETNTLALGAPSPLYSISLAGCAAAWALYKLLHAGGNPTVSFFVNFTVMGLALLPLAYSQPAHPIRGRRSTHKVRAEGLGMGEGEGVGSVYTATTTTSARHREE